MREISFKAKRLDNKEWTEGDLIGNAFYRCDTESDCCYILDYRKMKYYDFQDIWEQLDEYEVDPETICEYINFKDRDKTLVFTNDIVEFLYYDEFWDSHLYTGFIYKGEGCYKISTKASVFYINESIDINKVIGNKFDNAELLGK